MLSLLIVGLGNPGEKYSSTRHNLGFIVVQEVAKLNNAEWKKKLFRNYSYAKICGSSNDLHLIMPQTFMNCSGVIFPQVFQKTATKPSELLVICDYLDLPVGSSKIKLQGGSGGHNGLKSIIEHLGTDQFARILIGIGHPERKHEVIRHVLSGPQPEEWKVLQPLIHQIVLAINSLRETSLKKVEHVFNQKASAASESRKISAPAEPPKE